MSGKIDKINCEISNSEIASETRHLLEENLKALLIQKLVLINDEGHSTTQQILIFDYLHKNASNINTHYLFNFVVDKWSASTTNNDHRHAYLPFSLPHSVVAYSPNKRILDLQLLFSSINIIDSRVNMVADKLSHLTTLDTWIVNNSETNINDLNLE